MSCLKDAETRTRWKKLTTWWPDCSHDVVVVQLPSCVWLFATPRTAACQASLSLTVSQSLPKFMSTALVMPSNHLILWCLLLLLPSIFSSIRDFSTESVVHIRWPRYWSFTVGISPSNVYSQLISLKIGWFDLLAVKNLPQSDGNKLTLKLRTNCT